MELTSTDSSWLGKKIRIYIGFDLLTSSFFVSTVPTNHTAEVTVIGYTKPGFKPSLVLGCECNCSGLTPRNAPATSNLYVYNQEIYKFSALVQLPIEIAGAANVASVTNCRKCQNENLTGVGNSLDGTYICRQCSIFAHIFGSTP